MKAFLSISAICVTSVMLCAASEECKVYSCKNKIDGVVAILESYVTIVNDVKSGEMNHDNAALAIGEMEASMSALKAELETLTKTLSDEEELKIRTLLASSDMCEKIQQVELDIEACDAYLKESKYGNHAGLKESCEDFRKALL